MSLASLALAWPEVPDYRIGEHRGEVIFMVCRHEASCPTLHVGGGLLSCRCAPAVSFHVEPTLQ